jgi:hypothetical protein
MITPWRLRLLPFGSVVRGRRIAMMEFAATPALTRMEAIDALNHHCNSLKPRRNTKCENEKGLHLCKPFNFLVGRAGFEPATNGLKVRCSTS